MIDERVIKKKKQKKKIDLPTEYDLAKNVKVGCQKSNKLY